VSLPDLLARELLTLEERGLRRQLRTLDTPQGPEVSVEGREAINFSANNYLGLAASPELRAAAVAALEREGVGAGASRLIAGTSRSHRELERALADFHGADAALVFSSGYQANLGVLPALAGPEDAVFSDALNHASIVDGCRLSRARVVVYDHTDTDDLAAKLAATRARRRFIVTDTVFSMDGDVAPLGTLRQVADAAGAYLIIDEAHATGVLGPSGRGAAAAAGVQPDVHLATLGKALGTFGAYVTGARPLIDWLANRARSFVFTTAMPPAMAAAATAGLRIVASVEGDRLRSALVERMNQFATGLRALDLLAPGAGRTPIFPVLLGDESRALAASRSLLDAGIYAHPIRPPTVPPGTSRLRFALMATHTPGHIERALAALASVSRS
jgi:8-amino-7-oxononanoate synthase